MPKSGLPVVGSLQQNRSAIGLPCRWSNLRPAVDQKSGKEDSLLWYVRSSEVTWFQTRVDNDLYHSEPFSYKSRIFRLTLSRHPPSIRRIVIDRSGVETQFYKCYKLKRWRAHLVAPVSIRLCGPFSVRLGFSPALALTFKNAG